MVQVTDSRSIAPRGRGRPTTGKVHELRIPDELYEPLKEEARQQGAPIAEMLRRILAGRYEEEK